MNAARPRVLVAEDDDDLRELLLQVLGRAYAVVALEDGYELKDYLALAHATSVGAPDLIVSDVCMPGQTGFEALAPNGSWLPRCPVVLISGYTDSASRERARQQGVAAFLDKPLDLDALEEMIGQLLEARR